MSPPFFFLPLFWITRWKKRTLSLLLLLLLNTRYVIQGPIQQVEQHLHKADCCLYKLAWRIFKKGTRPRPQCGEGREKNGASKNNKSPTVLFLCVSKKEEEETFSCVCAVGRSSPTQREEEGGSHFFPSLFPPACLSVCLSFASSEMCCSLSRSVARFSF